ncbi:LysR family transcriptional regulator [Pandoraea sp.]|uniref:LysR family transcriptional regulator n=1 Tax=Pandoraea sp. TaxID=1883445 RepID=UPI0012135B1D|nr:LysR family transcriptional regulator [Pandoraea sp.]TAL52302.1 MAG: LysR family transcriptional regulator [Pandoraea sp.]TAM16112.1 MAG: LysR family transcriptional regulator [Pandoraea sp.]
MNHLLRKLDLTSLRLFVAVCQERNIARAAERECITPSAVSRRIAEIETVIGRPVIHRESRGISVTPVGEMVMRHAQAVIASFESLDAELSQFATGAKGSVKVVANLSAIVQFLPEDIAAYTRTFPDVEIQVDEKSTSSVLRSVSESSADFGICNAVPGIKDLEFLPYRTDRLFVLVPRGHRLCDATAVTLADMARENFVGLGSDTSLARLLAQQARSLGLDMKEKIRVNSFDALCRMVHVRLGIAVLPQHIGELYVDTLDLQLVPIAEPWASREQIVVFRQRERLTAAAAALVNFLTNKR